MCPVRTDWKARARLPYTCFRRGQWARGGGHAVPLPALSVSLGAECHGAALVTHFLSSSLECSLVSGVGWFRGCVSWLSVISVPQVGHYGSCFVAAASQLDSTHTLSLQWNTRGIVSLCVTVKSILLLLDYTGNRWDRHALRYRTDRAQVCSNDSAGCAS
jgi:hypothetical protein